MSNNNCFFLFLEYFLHSENFEEMILEPSLDPSTYESLREKESLFIFQVFVIFCFKILILKCLVVLKHKKGTNLKENKSRHSKVILTVDISKSEILAKEQFLKIFN